MMNGFHREIDEISSQRFLLPELPFLVLNSALSDLGYLPLEVLFHNPSCEIEPLPLRNQNDRLPESVSSEGRSAKVAGLTAIAL